MGVRVDHDEAVRSSRPMISTSWRPRTRRVLIAALILSVLIHLFGGAAYEYGRRVLLAAHLLRERVPKQNPNDYVATSDVIHIEKRTVPRRTNPRRPAPRPHPQSRPQPRLDPNVPLLPVPQLEPEKLLAHAETPQPIETLRPELSHETKKPAPRLAEVKTGGLPDATPEPNPETVKRTSPQRTQAKPATRNTNPMLSPQQIAALESQFEKTIQASREDLPSVVAAAKDPVGARKHVTMNFEGIHSNLRRGQGYMDPVSGPFRLRGGLVAYVMQYTYMYPDGHIESDVVPWTFVYPITNDPVGRHDRFLDMQLPPPGFRPSAARPLKPKEEEAYEAALSLQGSSASAR
jgi:hypothetical protein